jgi:hypothetical protein
MIKQTTDRGEPNGLLVCCYNYDDGSVFASEGSLGSYQTTRHYIPEDITFNITVISLVLGQPAAKKRSTLPQRLSGYINFFVMQEN